MKNKIQILIVEDDTSVATVLEARLKTFGYHVCDKVKTGAGAIGSALRTNPDVILMDILLEGELNGIEAAEIINEKMNVPIIYVTCLSGNSILEKAIQTNPYGYIVKPYDNAALRSTIEIAVIKYQAAKEREKLIAELETAVLKVKQLSGLLPICASCKKIRDEKGQWQQIETYIQNHSEADFSHGICPECSCKLYPELHHKNGKRKF